MVQFFQEGQLSRPEVVQQRTEQFGPNRHL